MTGSLDLQLHLLSSEQRTLNIEHCQGNRKVGAAIADLGKLLLLYRFCGIWQPLSISWEEAIHGLYFGRCLLILSCHGMFFIGMFLVRYFLSLSTGLGASFVIVNVGMSAVICGVGLSCSWILRLADHGAPVSNSGDESVLVPEPIACSGVLHEALSQADPIYARKLGERLFYISLVAAPVLGAVTCVFGYAFGNQICSACWISNFFQDTDIYLIGWTAFSVLVLYVWLLDHIVGNACKDSEKTVIEVCRKRHGSKDRPAQSLDIVAQDRYIVSSLVNKATVPLSRICCVCLVLCFLYFVALTGLVLSRRPAVILTVAAYAEITVIMFSILFVMMWLNRADDLERRLVNIRSRFPYRGRTNWNDEFRSVRDDIESLTQLCKDSKIGFRIFGLLITPNLVGSLFTGYVGILSFVFSMLKNSYH